MKQPQLIIRTCIVCKNSFEAKSRHPIYCSRKCSKRAEYLRNRTYYIEDSRKRRLADPVAWNSYCRKYWEKNAATLRLQARERRMRNADRVREYARMQYHKHKRKQRSVPEQGRARQIVYMAVKRGTIKRPEQCENCGKRGKVDAHHWNGYNNPLHVKWLCRYCHGFEHSKNKHLSHITPKYDSAQ